MRTSCRGKPMDSAWSSRSSRRTPCMLIRSEPSVTVVKRAVVRNCCRWDSAWSAIALSLPPLQQKRMGSGVVMDIFSYKLSSNSILGKGTEPCWSCGGYGPAESRVLQATLDPICQGGRHIGAPLKKAIGSRKKTAASYGLRCDTSGRGGNLGQGRESRWRPDI